MTGISKNKSKRGNVNTHIFAHIYEYTPLHTQIVQFDGHDFCHCNEALCLSLEHPNCRCFIT